MIHSIGTDDSHQLTPDHTGSATHYNVIMQVINCPACGHEIHASSDATLCPQCGEDVRTPRDSAVAIRACYQRASELAARGEMDAALDEVQRGLAHADAPDLHLLAAILCQRTGRMAEISTHVAAIPVDDSLRAEAEWLLRSQHRGTGSGVNAAITEGADDGFSLDEIVGRPPQVAPAPIKGRRRWPAAFGGLALLGLLIVWLASGDRWAQFGFDSTAESDTTHIGVEQGALSAESAIVNEDDEIGSDTVLGDGESEQRVTGLVLLPTPTPSAAPTPTPLPTATVPPDLVSIPTEASEVAGIKDSSPLTSDPIFDLKTYLSDGGYDDLAALEVSALVEASKLTLTGFVPSAAARTELTEVAESVPGVDSVSATELYVRPPTTYVVQPEDTLWSIAIEIYGDVSWMEAIYNANQDVMVSPSALVVGVELKLPPFE